MSWPSMRELLIGPTENVTLIMCVVIAIRTTTRVITLFVALTRKMMLTVGLRAVAGASLT